MSIILDGKKLAQAVRDELRHQASSIKSQLGRAPGLAVVLVGENPASKIYVASKSKAAREVGIEVFDLNIDATIEERFLLTAIEELNKDTRVDGILLQLPLPVGFSEDRALAAISPEKDVDGLHTISQGLLFKGENGFRPCTPLGCMMLIDKALEEQGKSKDLAGYEAVVVGRSRLVGKPIGMLLLERNCTVTYAHSKTRNLSEVTSRADILIAAIGRDNFITPSYVKKDAIVIDVGINRNATGKIVGDVQFEEVSKIASAITPVPGGVGPMTIAMLLKNTIISAKNKIK
jgi:methylenetetrahydrofolate dehydrogenase (NADP+)/methenyltetrahydrofolate cyclohydrolase